MKDFKVNTKDILRALMFVFVGSRLELLCQQLDWTPAICVAHVVEDGELTFVEESGNSKVVKPGGKQTAIAVK